MNSNITTKSLTPNQTTIIKGVAILSIALHNIFHQIQPFVGLENEFYFNGEIVKKFFSTIAEQPLEFINIFFSFLGHYGVEIFILLSGYGLAKSFANKPKSWGRFMIDRLKKIYSLLIMGVIIYAMFTIITGYRFINGGEWSCILRKFLFISNFLGDTESFSICGPWWFIGLIVQLYIIFPLIFKLINKHGVKAFILLSLISYAYIYTCMYVRITPNAMNLKCFIGHLPEFSLGILLARKDTINGNWLIFIISSVVFILGNYFRIINPLSFLSVSYISIFIFILAIKSQKSPEFLKKTFSILGKYSMAIFITHGMFRWPVSVMANNYQNTFITLGMVAIYLLTAFLIAYSADLLYNWIYGLFNRKRC